MKIHGLLISLLLAGCASAPTVGSQEVDPDSYAASQTFGARARAAGLWGIAYPSVRDPQHGLCVAVLRPRALHPVVQGPHFRYYWNGERIDAVEQYARLSLR